MDHDSLRDMLVLVDRLPGLRWGKVGATLFAREGPEVVRALRERGVQVFLDLKWHDIPSQVAGAVRAASAMGVALATVHALGGRRMLAAAQEAAGETRLVAVTVLTSHAAAELSEALGRPGTDPGVEVERLAAMAMSAGLAGVVASPAEVGRLRARLGRHAWLVVPGIRPAGSPSDDQARTATPRDAARAGATHLVVGRPITSAADPRAVYEGMCREARS